MKEVTVIIQCCVTKILILDDSAVAKRERLDDASKQKLAKEIAEKLDADNVSVSNYKAFIGEGEQS